MCHHRSFRTLSAKVSVYQMRAGLDRTLFGRIITILEKSIHESFRRPNDDQGSHAAGRDCRVGFSIDPAGNNAPDPVRRVLRTKLFTQHPHGERGRYHSMAGELQFPPPKLGNDPGRRPVLDEHHRHSVYLCSANSRVSLVKTPSAFKIANSP